MQTKNLNLAAYMFKIMEHCSRTCNVSNVDSASVLKYQHQWELEQNKLDTTKASKVDKNSWAKSMDNIVLHLKLMRLMSVFLLAYVVRCHIKVTSIPPGHDAYINLDENMFNAAPIFDAKLNLRMTQITLVRVYINFQCNIIKCGNALIH